MTTKQTYEFDKSFHSVYSLQYHLIIVVKYRRKVFTKEVIINRVKELTKQQLEIAGCKLINQECDTDHIHIIFQATPNTDLSKTINLVKGVSSRMLRKEFPELKKKLWGDSFWNNSYCLITTGQVTLDQLKKYVENQGK